LLRSGHLTEAAIKGQTVKNLLNVVREMESRKEISKEREQQKAQRETEQRKSEAQRAAEAKAEADKAQKELDKIAAHKAKALTEKLEAQRLQDIADAKQRLADAKAKAEAMKAEWDAGEAERKKERVAAERAAVAETARKEGRRASHVKSIVEKVERVLVDDSLYELIRDLKKTTALTPAERKNLKTALQDAGVRFREHASKF
jgi:membrane protein involved in colicin uptake